MAERTGDVGPYNRYINRVDIKVSWMRGVIPYKLNLQTPGSSGIDLCCLQDLNLQPYVVKLVHCGFCLQIPGGWEGQVRSRSSLGLRGIIIPNAPGTIDSDYRGEICVPLLVVLDRVHYHEQTIPAGSRIAQMVFAPVGHPIFHPGPLDETERGSGGFGSTGE